jgi:hypothetical protein
MKSFAATLHPTAGALPRRARTTDSPAARLTSIAAVLFGVALLAATVTPARAWDDRSDISPSRSIRDIETWADGQLVDVQLRVDGEASPLYVGPGHDDRRYFQAFAGRNYSIVLRNNTGRRVAVLLAVDGLNAVNGEITRLRSSEDMYVLGAYEQATIRGWRTSLDEVRRFVFVDERKSYAQRTGQANSDMGWIRVLSFREQLPWLQSRRGYIEGERKPQFRDDRPQGAVPLPAPVPMNEAPRAQSGESKDSAPTPTTRSLVPQEQDNMARGEEDNGGSFPGTGWGQRQQDHVNRTQFTPDPVAVDRLIFRYEYASGLQALGILPVRRNRDRLGERDGELGFAKPPRW